MGQAKKYMMMMEELEYTATSVLVKAGALERCAVHGVAVDTFDPDAVKKAYAIGTIMVQKGEVDASREDFMEAINRAYKNSAMDCGYCAKHEAD